MAITTLDGLVAGMLAPVPFFKIGTAHEAAGVAHSHFYAAGMPGAAVAPSPGLGGAALTSYAGQLPFSNPVSGNSYLAVFDVFSNTVSTLWLMDRLWHNSGIVVTTTTAQTINSVAWPARDRAGTTNGAGVMVAIEVSTATTNAGAIANTTMSYTNQDGTAGRTATMASFPATAVLGTFVPFQLAAGDTGVRSIQTVTLGTSYAGGAIHLVAYRMLALVAVPVASSSQNRGSVGLGMVRLFDNTVPFLVNIANATTAQNIHGQIVISQG